MNKLGRYDVITRSGVVSRVVEQEESRFFVIHKNERIEVYPMGDMFTFRPQDVTDVFTRTLEEYATSYNHCKMALDVGCDVAFLIEFGALRALADSIYMMGGSVYGKGYMELKTEASRIAQEVSR